MPRYTLCPYYIDENKKTISCEDVCRSFDSLDKKWAWMDMYCDSWDWMRCPYAVDRAEAYNRLEEGDAMALEIQENEALRKENDSLRMKLGRSNKRVDRQQKRIDKLRELVKSYQRRNEELYAKWREADTLNRAQDDKIWGELDVLTGIYEQRMCYLIDKYAPEKKFFDKDVKEWAGDKEFALVDFKDAETNERYWKVCFGPGEEIEDVPEENEE